MKRIYLILMLCIILVLPNVYSAVDVSKYITYDSGDIMLNATPGIQGQALHLLTGNKTWAKVNTAILYYNNSNAYNSTFRIYFPDNGVASDNYQYVNTSMDRTNITYEWDFYASNSVAANSEQYLYSHTGETAVGIKDSVFKYLPNSTASWIAFTTPFTVGWHHARIMQRINTQAYVCIDSECILVGTNTNYGTLYLHGYNTKNFSIDNLKVYRGNVTPAEVDSTILPVYTGLSTGQTNNTKEIILNISCSVGNVSVWFDKNTTPATQRYLNISPILLFNFSPYVTIEGKYYLMSSCDVGTNNYTSVFTWTYDITSPNIIINPTTSFNTLNTSVLYSKNLSVNVTGTDNIDLYGFEFLIYNSSRHLVYNKTNITLTGRTTYTYQNYTDISSWGFGSYYWNTTWSDTHTNNDEFKDGKDYLFNKESKKLTVYTWQNNQIEIETNLDTNDIELIKQRDRYSFEYNFKPDIFGRIDNKKIFVLKCDGKLEYYPNSKYIGHFVCINGKQGNWIDFETDSREIPIIKQKKEFFTGKDYYEIEFNNELSIMKFNSIGGLNVNTLSGSFNVSNLTMNLVTFNYEIGQSHIYFRGYANATEGIGRNVSYEYKWYYNNTINETGFYNNTFSGIRTLISTLDNPNFNRSKMVNFSARAFIDSYYTSWYNYSLYFDYAIDDCSVGVTGLTNGTAYYFMFVDGNLGTNLEVNLSTSLEYVFGGNTYNYYTSAARKNFSYCIYPQDVNITADFEFNYIYNTVLYSYIGTNSHFDNITNYINLTIYPASTNVLATVYDEINQFVEECYIEVYKYDTVTGNFNLQGTYKTNFEGQSLIPLTINTQKYIFKLYYPVSNLVKTTSETYIYSTSINFQIVIGDLPLADYYTESGVVGNITFNNNTYRFTYSFSDSSAEISNGCLYLYRQYQGQVENYNSSCVSGTSGIIILPVTNQTNVLYIAKGFVELNNQDRLIAETSYFFNDRDIIQKIGLSGILIDIILTILISFVFTFSIPIAVVVMPIPSLILSYMGIISISIPILWTLEILAVIIAIMINNRG